MSVDTLAGVFVGWRTDRLPATPDEWDAQDALIDQPDGTTSITFPAMGGRPGEQEVTFVGRWVARWDGRDPILIPITGRSIVPGREPDPAPSFGDGWTWGVWFIGDRT